MGGLILDLLPLLGPLMALLYVMLLLVVDWWKDRRLAEDEEVWTQERIYRELDPDPEWPERVTAYLDAQGYPRELIKALESVGVVELPEHLKWARTNERMLQLQESLLPAERHNPQAALYDATCGAPPCRHENRITYDVTNFGGQLVRRDTHCLDCKAVLAEDTPWPMPRGEP